MAKKLLKQKTNYKVIHFFQYLQSKKEKSNFFSAVSQSILRNHSIKVM